MPWFITKEDRGKAMSMIAEGLRAKSAQVAMDVGINKVVSVSNGFDTVMTAMTAAVFPQSRAVQSRGSRIVQSGEHA